MLPSRCIANFLAILIILSAAGTCNHAASTRPDDVNLVGIPGPYSFASFCRLKTKELWTVGGDGTVHYTNTAGTLQRHITDEDLNGVYFVNSAVGWVVGNSGTILHTKDRGYSWSRQQTGVKQSLRAITCSSEGRCWSVGGAGMILKTVDGGQHWEQTRATSSDDLFAVDFVDDQNGWVAGANGLVLHTSNGGEMWETQHATITLFPKGPFASSTDLLTVKFFDQNLGWVAGSGGIAVTIDGGKTWKAKEIEDGSFIGLVSNDGKKVWAISRNRTNYVTSDSGKTWKPTIETSLAKHQPKPLNQLSSMAFRRRRKP